MESNSQKFKFKTNVNCGGCVSTIKPLLDSIKGISEWSVDTNNADKILTVTSEGITQEAVMEPVQKAGFRIEPLA
jgi:copper chaperone CopZ